jgi:peptide/nickel transport system substrate-binding protein
MALPDMPQADLNIYNAGYPNGYVISSMMEGLVTFQNANTELKPLLAASWRNVNPTTWEFTLKPNVQFHDGTPLRASDVVFSIKSGLDQNIAALSFATFTRNFGTLDDITAPEPNLVRVTTKTPDPIMPNRFGALGVYIMPEAAFRAQGRDAFFQRPIGTGPFRFQSWTPRQRIEMVRNQNWHGGQVGLESLTAVAITENTPRIATLRTGEADMAQRVDVDQIPDIERTPGAKVVPAVFNVGVVGFMNTNVEQLRDKRVRQAMNHSLDIATYTRTVLRGITQPLPGQPVPLTTFGANQQLRPFEFNVQRARQLMVEGGFPNGFRIDLGVPTFREQFARDGQAIQPMLAAIGVQTDLRPFDITAFQQGNVPNGADRLPPIVISAVSTAELADPATAYASFLPPAQNGVGRWTNPEWTNLFNQAQGELDVNRRRAAFERMNAIFNDEAPMLYLYQFWDMWGVTDKVGPFVPTPGGQPECWCNLIRVRQ